MIGVDDTTFELYTVEPATILGVGFWKSPEVYRNLHNMGWGRNSSFYVLDDAVYTLDPYDVGLAAENRRPSPEPHPVLTFSETGMASRFQMAPASLQ